MVLEFHEDWTAEQLSSLVFTSEQLYTLIGGSVGAVVGIAAGIAISDCIDWVHKQPWYKDGKKWVGSQTDKLFGRSKSDGK
ncbi:hypothetical protein OZX62_07445 [Bifidobacterium sp. ESL0690]|uniref:hypothetical protein n=1 Tax=Bifidobacterium sp. ESL0690 TaxID=2983214 RepID=UPI0023F672E8|nr:hypothetical protein [Bifidobacterium sp. ESL0690]WEV46272.1 hypothetical protein OZX62_07445 [Bifidobacterium sp. ESL0690]